MTAISGSTCPVGYLYTMGNPRTDWCLKTEPEPGLNGRALNYPRGKVLGGCSAINGMIYMRGQAADYDHWRQLGNRGLGAGTTCCPSSSGRRTTGRVRDEFHGAGGEWRIEPPRVAWEILDAFRDAAEQCGIPKTDDFNRGDNEGCGYFQVTQTARHPLDHRQGVPAARPRPAEPDRVDRCGGRAGSCSMERRCTGVGFRRRGQEQIATARRRGRPRSGRDRLRPCSSSCPASAPATFCSDWASRCGTSCLASAATCRTTCSSGWCSRSRAR